MTINYEVYGREIDFTAEADNLAELEHLKAELDRQGVKYNTLGKLELEAYKMSREAFEELGGKY